MYGILESLIASILYNAAKNGYRQFNDAITKALDDTSVYFLKKKNIEFKVDKFKDMLEGIGLPEVEKLKTGSGFIDGDRLAVQFAAFGEVYDEDENKIISMARDIMGYFIDRLEHHLLSNPKTGLFVILSLDFVQ
jgi:hypothetical protein